MFKVVFELDACFMQTQFRESRLIKRCVKSYTRVYLKTVLTYVQE